MDASNTCINCKTSTTNSFCENCGLEQNRPRITFRTLGKDVYNILFGFESSFWQTTKHLLNSPATVIQQYTDGNNKRYWNPIRWLIIISAFAAIFSIGLNIDQIEDINTAAKLKSDDLFNNNNAGLQALQNKLNLLFPIIVIPFLSFFSFLFYKNHLKYNLAEHHVIHMFAIGITTLMGILVMILVKGILRINYPHYLVMLLISSAYYMYLFISLGTSKSTSNGLKGFCIFWIGIISFVLVFIVLVLILNIFLAFF